MLNFESDLQFPDGFLWGVATSAYQVEGDSVNTQWYEFEQAGGIKTGERSGKACDWWEHAERDFDIARAMGLNSLRLSVSWARIEPEDGIFDPRAIERYRQMLAALIERNIKPVVCLHHFAHPGWFEQLGAFLAPDCVEKFNRFVRFTVCELGDLCNDWLTFNEPNVYALEGYIDSHFPPARFGHVRQFFQVLGNMGHCHAAAYRTIHSLQKDARVSFANHFIIFTGLKGHPFDQFAARIASDSFNNVFINMITGKKVPLLSSMVGNTDDMLGTWDYIGVNIYGGVDVAFDIFRPQTGFVRRIPPKNKHTGDLDPRGRAMFGEIYPQGIQIVVEKLSRHRKPFFILENGVPDRNDALRPWVIATAVKTIYDMIDKGHQIIGYHHWTLVDNYEWLRGYYMKFGLVEMDPATQERKPRRSAAFFSQIARENGLTRQMVSDYVNEPLLP